jgi:putative endonuclease
MTASRRLLGDQVEEAVARTLARGGAAIVARNVRTRAVRGEIDLIALDRGELVFVEVKGRRAGAAIGPERPVLAVTAGKRRKLRALARAWLAENRPRVPANRGLRFDVVGVTVDGAGGVLDWEHLRGAF